LLAGLLQVLEGCNKVFLEPPLLLLVSISGRETLVSVYTTD